MLLLGIPLSWATGETLSMRKQCPECRSVIHAEVARCPACGANLAGVALLTRHEATWKGRLAAVTCGLVAAVIMQALHG
jgi:rRNA maturation endonuclease Nob1